MSMEWNGPSGSSELPWRLILEQLAINKSDILRHLDRQSEHVGQRIDDLRQEVVPRLERAENRLHGLEQRISRAAPENEPSLVRSLFGTVGAWLIGVIPWKHVLFMLPGIVIAIFGHLMPEQTRQVLTRIGNTFIGP